MLYVLLALRTLLMLGGMAALVNYLLPAGAWQTFGVVIGSFLVFLLAGIDLAQTAESSN